MSEYEYGIDWRDPKRRDAKPHRIGMTLDEAKAFLVNDPDDKFNWNDIFTIIYRLPGVWKDIPSDPKDVPSSTAGLVPPHIARCCAGCGRSAESNGYCGLSGCYDIPG